MAGRTKFPRPIWGFILFSPRQCTDEAAQGLAKTDGHEPCYPFFTLCSDHFPPFTSHTSLLRCSFVLCFPDYIWQVHAIALEFTYSDVVPGMTFGSSNQFKGSYCDSKHADRLGIRRILGDHYRRFDRGVEGVAARANPFGANSRAFPSFVTSYLAFDHLFIRIFLLDPVPWYKLYILNMN